MKAREFLGSVGHGLLVILILGAAGVPSWTLEWYFYGTGMILCITLLRMERQR